MVHGTNAKPSRHTSQMSSISVAGDSDDSDVVAGDASYICFILVTAAAAVYILSSWTRACGHPMETLTAVAFTAVIPATSPISDSCYLTNKCPTHIQLPRFQRPCASTKTPSAREEEIQVVSYFR